MADEAKQMVPDSRPRVAYVLPDGTEVAIIFDHGEHQPQSVTYQLGDGRVVYATKAPPPNLHEDAARLRKRDRIVAQVVLQAHMNPKVTWAQWAKFLGDASAHYAEAFIRSCGERVSDTTMSKTWPLVVAVVQSWADSDARVLAFEARR